MPIMDREFFRVVFQNSEFVKSICNDGNNPFHFACHRCIKNP